MKGYAIRPASGKSADFLSGILFLLIGSFFSIYAHSYPLGSAARLGPGAFPFYVGLLLGAIGLFLVLKSWAERGEAIHPFNIKSMGLITLSLILGAATLTSLGVIFAVPITVVVASLAARRARVMPVIAMAILLTAFTYLVFVVALGIQLPLYPGAR